MRGTPIVEDDERGFLFAPGALAMRKNSSGRIYLPLAVFKRHPVHSSRRVYLNDRALATSAERIGRSPTGVRTRVSRVGGGMVQAAELMSA